MRKIICKETGEVFNSIAEATIACGYDKSKSNIRVALTKRPSHRAWSYTWFYLDSIEGETLLKEVN